MVLTYLINPRVNCPIQLLALVTSKLRVLPNRRETTLFFFRGDESQLLHAHRSKRLLIAQFVNKLNSKMPVGCYSVDCRSGALLFKYSVSFTSRVFLQSENYIEDIQKDIEICISIIQKSLPLILDVCDISQGQFKQSEVISNIRRLSNLDPEISIKM